MQTIRSLVNLMALSLFWLVPLSAGANWNDPNEPFSTKSNAVGTMLITWNPVDDVQMVCELEYKRRGFDAIKIKVDACSFWNFVTRTCTIYTKKNPTMHDLGHELRHCYQGSWH